MALLNLRIVSPLAQYLDELDEGNTLAPRPASLEGKIVGLLPNWRPSAVHILEAIGALVEEQCKPKAVVMEQMQHAQQLLVFEERGDALLQFDLALPERPEGKAAACT